MTKKQAQEYIGERIFKELFQNWMYGQTIGKKAGKVDYYEYDVERFVDSLITNKKPLFD